MRYIALLLRSLLFALLIYAPSVYAQSFIVEEARPQPGTAAVDLSGEVAFAFSEEISVSTDWNTAFVSAPRDALSYSRVSLCLNFEGPCDGGDDVPRFVRFQAQHRPDTDYTWMVYAVETPSGAPMDAPYVLRYTTASTIGQRAVAGTVSAPAAKATWSASVRNALGALARGMKRSGLGRLPFGREDREGLSPTKEMGTIEPIAEDELQVRSHVGMIGAKGHSGGHTQVLLLDAFDDQASSWAVRAADVIKGASGNFTVEHLRDGTYWPIAVRYTDGTNAEIEALGFHDASGDGEPDPVTVDGGSVADINVQLYEFPLSTAHTESNLMAAIEAAAQHAPDQELKTVQGGHGMRTDGSAYEWTYRFYSPSKGLVTEVRVDPIEVTVTTTTPLSSFLTEMETVPESFIDSDEALQAALNDGGQAFIDPYPSRNLTTSLQGGNLYWMADTPTSNAFWQVRLQANTSSGTEVFERFVDMETGAILDAEALPVELTAFTAQVSDGTTVLLRWETASESNNAGFEVEHQAPESDAFEAVAFVEGAGTASRPQQYRYRIAGAEPGVHRFRLRQVDTDGAFAYSPEVEVRVSLNESLALEAPYPNPLAGHGTIRYRLPRATEVRLAVYDLLGREVAVIVSERQSAGAKTAPVDGSRLPSGAYFIRLATPKKTLGQRLTIVR